MISRRADFFLTLLRNRERARSSVSPKAASAQKSGPSALFAARAVPALSGRLFLIPFPSQEALP